MFAALEYSKENKLINNTMLFFNNVFKDQIKNKCMME